MYKVTFEKSKKDGSVNIKRSGSIADVVNEVHGTIVAHCDYCGAPMTPSDVNDYDTLCESCYIREYN